VAKEKRTPLRVASRHGFDVGKYHRERGTCFTLKACGLAVPCQPYSSQSSLGASREANWRGGPQYFLFSIVHHFDDRSFSLSHRCFRIFSG
jgi:hypothetical protein